MLPLKVYKNSGGFTLIELIATMVIMGIIGIGAALFLTYIAQGFFLAKTNQTVFQKANIAIERLMLEMKHMEQISAKDNTSISFKRNGNDFGIALVAGTIKINRGGSIPNADTGYILIDNVNNFNLVFENGDGNAWAVLADNSLTGLAKVTITLVLDLEGSSRTFTMEINPLFNDMVNGPTT